MARPWTLLAIGVALLSAASARHASAQVSDPPPTVDLGEGFTVSIGVKAGIVSSRTTNDAATSRVGPAAGAFLTLQGDGHVGLQVEALYIRRGYVIAERSVSLDYLEYPILLRFKGPRLAGVRPFVLAGPSFGRLARATYGSEVERTQNLFKNDLQSWTFGWVLAGGLDVSLPHSRGGLVLEVRRDLGATSALVANSSYGDENGRHRAVTGLVGYRFTF
jgi:hypothetical protein